MTHTIDHFHLDNLLVRVAALDFKLKRNAFAKPQFVRAICNARVTYTLTAI